MSRPDASVKSVPNGPSAVNAKGKSSDFKKDRKGSGGAPADKSKPSKPTPAPREAPKKMFRLVVRKLPFKDFGEVEFVKSLDTVCGTADAGLIRAAFTLEHFHAGKISRKRGEVYSSGFLTVNDEAQYWKFLAVCPLKVPFLEGVDESAQPEICVAPNQKAFKLKERTDRHINTFETDPAFLEFTAKLNTPVDKLPSAEMQLDLKKNEANKEELMRSNPLLMYMREKAEKKALERRLLRRGGSGKALVVTSVTSKSSRGGKSRSERGERAERGEKGEGKEKKRSERSTKAERREKKEKGEAVEKSERSGGGRGGGGSRKETGSERAPREDREGAEVPGGSAKKPSSRGSRGGGKASRAYEVGGSAQGGDSSTGGPPPLTVPKFTIAKRNAPLPSTGGSASLHGPGSAPQMSSQMSSHMSQAAYGHGPPPAGHSGDARVSVSAGASAGVAASGAERAPRKDRGGRGGRGGDGQGRNETHVHGGGEGISGSNGQIGFNDRSQGGARSGGRSGGRGGRGRGNFDGATA